MSKYIITLAAALPLLPLAADAETPSPEAAQVKSVVAKAVDDTIVVLKDKNNDKEERRRKIYAIMDPVVDWALMGKLTLGRDHWPQFKPDQQKEFIGSFSTVIRDSIFDKIQVYTNETVEFEPAAPGDKGKYQLPMRVFSQGQKYKALFKLYKNKQGDWKVYDLEIEGMSMVRIYSAQYDQFLAKGTPDGLLEKIKSKALAVPDEFKHIAKKKTAEKEGKE